MLGWDRDESIISCIVKLNSLGSYCEIDWALLLVFRKMWQCPLNFFQDFYRKNRDYSNILDEDDECEEVEEEYEEEDDDDPDQYEKSKPNEDPVAVGELQEYLERREQLK